MIQIHAKYLAPLHDSDMNLIAVADAAQAGYVNYLTMVRMGLLGKQTDFSEDGAKAIARDAAKYNIRGVMEMLATMSQDRRSELALRTEMDFNLQTAKLISIADQNPSSPLLIWADCSVHLVTSDNVVIMGLRGNAASEAGKIVPLGYGWRNIAPNGQPYSLANNAAMHLKNKAGLNITGVQDVGIVRSINEVEAYISNTTYGWFVPCITPLFSYVGMVRLNSPAAEVLDRITLNNQNFGVVALKVQDIERLAAGQQVRLDYHSSTALAAVSSFTMAFTMQRDAPPVNLAEYRTLMSGDRVDSIPPTTDDGKPLRYAVAKSPCGLMTEAADVTGVGRSYLAEAVAGLVALGVQVSPEAKRYGHDHAHLEPLVERKVHWLGPRSDCGPASRLGIT